MKCIFYFELKLQEYLHIFKNAVRALLFTIIWVNLITCLSKPLHLMPGIHKRQKIPRLFILFPIFLTCAKFSDQLSKKKSIR